MKFKKIRAGLYVSAEGYEVERDATGYITIEERDGRGINCGCDDDGWSLSLDGNVIDWFDTKREAIAEANRRAG